MAETVFDRDLPVVMRLDGRAFSVFTERLRKLNNTDGPFDGAFGAAMHTTAAALMREFGAIFAYTQSDEITLVFAPTSDVWEPPFGYRQMKLVSLTASYATAVFGRQPVISSCTDMPTFDCRAWQVADLDAARDAVLERMHDNNRNFIQMCARHLMSHSQLQGLSVRQQQAKLDELGYDWRNVHPHFRYGTCLLDRGSRAIHRSESELESADAIFAKAQQSTAGGDGEFDWMLEAGRQADITDRISRSAINAATIATRFLKWELLGIARINSDARLFFVNGWSADCSRHTVTLRNAVGTVVAQDISLAELKYFAVSGDA